MATEDREPDDIEGDDKPSTSWKGWYGPAWMFEPQQRAAVGWYDAAGIQGFLEQLEEDEE